MKLSKILETKDLTSVTISVIAPTVVTCEIFTKGKDTSILKAYKSMNVDVNVPETSNDNVKHLGIKRYYHLVEENYYVNLYYY